jgi:hypothetical protein
MAKRRPKAIDPVATLDQAEAAVEAGDRGRAHGLLKAYRRWRLAGNAAPPGGDERYGELVDRTGPKFTLVNAEADSSPSARPPVLPADALAALARLLLSWMDRIREKYRGVEVDPVAALRDAEQALERGDLEAAGKHLEDYRGFRVCGGKEPPEGRENYDLLLKRLSALKRQPW